MPEIMLWVNVQEMGLLILQLQVNALSNSICLRLTAMTGSRPRSDMYLRTQPHFQVTYGEHPLHSFQAHLMVTLSATEALPGSLAKSHRQVL